MEQQQERSWWGKAWRVVRGVFWGFVCLQVLVLIFGGFRKSFADLTDDRVKIACVRIDDLITDSTFLVKKINKFAKHDDIAALLVRIDSPGGYPGSSEAIASEILRFKTHKPVIALVENSCASGAYWIASAADYIIAPGGALVGSIGVLTELPNFKDLMSYCKVNYTYLQAGSYKTAGGQFKENSEREMRYLQGLCDEAYNQFINAVAQNRGLDRALHAQWADGKLFTGSQALELKLIDQLGTYSDAIAQLHARLGLQEDVEFKLIYPKRPSRIEKLLGMGKDDVGVGAKSASLARFCAAVLQRLMVINTVPQSH